MTISKQEIAEELSKAMAYYGDEALSDRTVQRLASTVKRICDQYGNSRYSQGYAHGFDNQQRDNEDGAA